jgi:hypothetical protein
LILAIHQPNYLPWLGYFHKMKQADAFMFLDNVQIPGKGLSNRNFIKGKNGSKVMLSVPLKKSKGMHSTYLEVVPDYSKPWQKEHINKIKDAYYKAPHFNEVFEILEPILVKKYEHLCDLNTSLIIAIAHLLDIKTPVLYASSMINHQLSKNERNIDLCKQVKANIYLSGQGAKKYNDEILFLSNNINIIYQSFKLPEYQQIGSNFIPNLSVLDALFNIDNATIKKIIYSQNL